MVNDEVKKMIKDIFDKHFNKEEKPNFFKGFQPWYFFKVGDKK